MRYKKFYAFIISLCLAIGSIAQTHNWTRFYIGPNLGADNSQLTISNPVSNVQFHQVTAVFVPTRGIVIIPGTTRPFLRGSSTKKTTVTGGIQLGYMKQFNQWVFGLEGDVNYSSTKLSEDLDDSLPPTILVWYHPYGFHRTASMNFTESLRAKIGYATNHSLIYLTIGAFAGIKKTIMDYYSFSYWAVPSIDGGRHPMPGEYNFVTSYNKETKHPIGLTFGVGYDYMIADNISLGIEYRYSSVSKLFTTNNSDPNGGGPFPDTTFHDLRVGDKTPVFGSIAPTSQNFKFTSNKVTVRLNFSLDAILNGSKKNMNTNKSNMKKK